MQQQQADGCLPPTLKRFEDALDKVSAIPRIRNCLFQNRIVLAAVDRFNAQYSNLDGADTSFIIHHPTLLAPFPSHLFPTVKRRDVTDDLLYRTVPQAVLNDYHQSPVRSSVRTPPRATRTRSYTNSDNGWSRSANRR